MMLRAGGVVGALLAARGARADTLEFNSAYNFVNIEKSGSVVNFNYSLFPGRLSAIDLARPAYQVIAYTRYYCVADLIRRGPRSALMAGLGAGGFNRLFNLIHPEARLVTVEIDPMILRLAEEHAGFRTGPNNEVVIDDARMFMRRSRDSWDWIVLDAFDRHAQIPVHLATREFYEIVRDRLAPDGVMVTNLHQGSRFFASSVLTIRAVFPEVVVVPVRGRGNAIVAATNSPADSIGSRLAASIDPAERARYQAQGVDLEEIVHQAMHERDWLKAVEGRGRVLTDDFAPVESLAREPMPAIRPRREEHG
jgi:spermidine synthase